MNLSRSQFSASAISNHAENHVSLVSVNVDFSLMKVAAPSEYDGLGKSLSIPRNIEAESGQSHATAAKLGALFDGLVPPVPHLLSAYGTRCSEIAKSQTFNPTGTRKHGFFADRVGADGTTIWAAATSGSSAIAVHLLACMLARIWDSPKAVSIWMELILVRKQTLTSSGKPMDFYPSQIALTREQIANWDASARAWRLTADQANERRQKQLLLIIDHLGLPVSGKLELSDSVIDAWRSAMVTVDKLIAGEPQSVQTGAPLLGLASWHLYPDMVIFGKDKEVKEAKQRDPLIHPGGIITLGIADTRREGDGIYWSLPLAHLRYYGDPVPLEACLHSQTSRVSINQLLHVALGSLIRRWCADVNDIEHAAKLLVKMNDFVGYPSGFQSLLKLPKNEQSWLQLLASAAREFLDAEGAQRYEILQLIKCGRRRYPAYVDHPATNSVFGLSDCKTFLGMFPGNFSRVVLLREISKEFSDNHHLMVIQCKVGSVNSEWELASVERHYSEIKRGRDGETTPRRYFRWLNRMHRDTSFQDEHSDSDTLRLPGDRSIPWLWAPQSYQWQNAPREFYSKFLENSCSNEALKAIRGATVRSRFLFGDPATAALYSIAVTYWKKSPNEDSQTLQHQQLRSLPSIFVIRHILWAFEKQVLSPLSLLEHLSGGKYSSGEVSNSGDAAIVKSLRGLFTVWILYQSLPYATVELRVASRPLCEQQWIPDTDRNQLLCTTPFELNTEATFACIAKHESGNFNFHPSAMEGVHVISSGNSLYIAKCLLQDPCEHPATALVERVVGNLGKSGMAMLVSPEVPRVRPITHDYSLVCHDPFDGCEENCFQHTTLHMSFTDWQLPIDVGSRGIRDIEAYYIEAAIGVYDNGKWVADVNIPEIFRHKFARIIPKCIRRHETHIAQENLSKFVAIDSWEELLDSPPEIGVVRVRGNWQARLAAAALGIQRGHETRVLPEQVCWTCCDELAAIARNEPEDEEDQLAHEDNIIIAQSDPYDEDSDSDMDELVERELIKFKGKQEAKLSRHTTGVGENLGASEDLRGTSTSNRNILYIM